MISLVKKQLVQRILLLCLLYLVVFTVITLVQFTGQTRPEPVAVHPGEKIISPEDFIIREAQTANSFNAAISGWRNDKFQLWNRLVPQQNNENLVTSYLTEALNRSAYTAALSMIPTAFLNGSQRTHDSGAYLGRVDQSARTLIAQDQEKLNRISRLILEKSMDLLNEDKVFEFLFIRGNTSLIEQGVDVIHSLDLDAIELGHCIGIFQAYNDWNQYNPSSENPFGYLTGKACDLILEWLDEQSALNQAENPAASQIDVEFNLQLGMALLECAESVQDETWTALARSIILSALFVDEESDDPLSSARAYRILEFGGPRAVVLNTQIDNIWAWTAARSIRASMQNNVLDISANFPVGESHYLIIRGIRPFTRLQFYGTDWRSDPQFERYDSSGWVYMAADQTLLIKLRHRSTEEHIVIYF